MIAIVGAKGGSGKTTVSLGLAGAFSRSGRPTVVVDADRQLPNLHVTAGVDREPTLAELGRGDDLASVAQSLPDTSDVAVVPAPKNARSVDVESTLGGLEVGERQVLVDCPSGAGPDLVEPLAAADAAVVVTTTDDPGVETAEMTIDVAERLGTPVTGAVVSRSADVPADLASRLDVPVLGAVPEAGTDDPLDDEAVRAAFDEVLTELRARRYPHFSMTGDVGGTPRIPTGIEAVDGEFDGGLPPGTVVALSADPASQSELLLYRFTGARGTLYLSTERSEPRLREEMAEAQVDAGTPTVRRVDGADPLEDAAALVAELPDGANLVVDYVNLLESADREAYVEFLDELKRRVRETGSIAVLHCLKPATAPDNRPSTLHAVDAVFDLTTTTEDGRRRDRLAVRKFRNDTAPAEAIELDLDLSRGVEAAGAQNGQT
jgi:KaiC/GvpD/RAD55 family RecA-like ATPase